MKALTTRNIICTLNQICMKTPNCAVRMGSTPGLGWNSARRVANLTEGFYGLPQSLCANARITTSDYIRMISFFILFNSFNTTILSY
jgi:hypothetical protein